MNSANAIASCITDHTDCCLTLYHLLTIAPLDLRYEKAAKIFAHAFAEVCRCFLPDLERRLQAVHGPSNGYHRMIGFSSLNLLILIQLFGALHPDLWGVQVGDTRGLVINRHRVPLDQLGRHRRDPEFRLSYN